MSTTGPTGLHPRGMFADRLDPGPRTKAVQELLHSLPEPVLTLQVVSDRSTHPAQRPRTRPACQGRMGVRIVVEIPGGSPGIGPVLRLRCALVSVSGAAQAAGYQVRPCLSLWCRCP
ncbi:MAG: hypothetical protein JWN05_437 [Arthrobacter sp.]|jgi:hypothetical protein|nr:hypothetical protein [Arthrobacter sp.]